MLQCYQCGKVYAKYETKRESSIKDFVESEDNPHNIGKTLIGLDNKKRLTPTQKERKRKLEEIEKEKNL